MGHIGHTSLAPLVQFLAHLYCLVPVSPVANMRKAAIALLAMAMLAVPMLAAGGPDSASRDGSWSCASIDSMVLRSCFPTLIISDI